MLLSEALNNQKVTIVSLNLSDERSNRLTSLGLFPGSRIRVIDNSIKKTSVIECKGSRLALGRGLSDFIVVK